MEVSYEGFVPAPLMATDNPEWNQMTDTIQDLEQAISMMESLIENLAKTARCGCRRVFAPPPHTTVP